MRTATRGNDEAELFLRLNANTCAGKTAWRRQHIKIFNRFRRYDFLAGLLPLRDLLQKAGKRILTFTGNDVIYLAIAFEDFICKKSGVRPSDSNDSAWKGFFNCFDEFEGINAVVGEDG